VSPAEKKCYFFAHPLGQELSNAPSSDDEFPSVDLPFAIGEMADKCILFFPLFLSLYSYRQFWRELLPFVLFGCLFCFDLL
jgi:hypothetical protein